MVTQDRHRHVARRRVDPDDWRWWAATGGMSLVATAAGGLTGFALFMELIPGMGDALTRPWIQVPVILAPLALAGLVTGAVGGLRRWWLLVPAAAVPAVAFLSVLGLAGNLVAGGVLSVAAGLISVRMARRAMDR